jgi:hypothetical protein
LTVAAELYSAERYFPALALAAMAEEIFEAVMRSRNVRRPGNSIGLRFVPDKYTPISEELIGIAGKLFHLDADDDKERRKIYGMLYRAKNSAKHGTLKGGRKFNLSIDCDAELEAWSMLGRAVENLIRLHYEPQGEVLKFFRAYRAGRKTEHHEGASIGLHAKPYTIPTQKPWKLGDGD